MGAADNTAAWHTARAAHLIRVFGVDYDIAGLTVAELNRYTDVRLAEKAHRHTVQKDHRVLRHALRLAKEAGRYDGDPKSLKVEGFVSSRAFYRPGCAWLEHVEHIDALVTHTSSNPDNHRVDRRDDMLVYVNLGLRRREPLVLTPERVDLRKRVLRVKTLGTRRLKTEGSERELPLNDLMYELFKRRMKGAKAGEPLFTEWGSGNRDLKANWKRARAWLLAQAPDRATRATLDVTLPKSLTFNDLRRTFCSQMRNAGVSVDDCVALLGHADRAMVEQVYGKLSMDTLRRAVAALPAMTLPESRQRKRAPTVLATNRVRESWADTVTCGSEPPTDGQVPEQS